MHINKILAGNLQGSSDATCNSAQFLNPGEITIYGTNLYFTNTTNRRNRKIK